MRRNAPYKASMIPAAHVTALNGINEKKNIFIILIVVTSFVLPLPVCRGRDLSQDPKNHLSRMKLQNIFKLGNLVAGL